MMFRTRSRGRKILAAVAAASIIAVAAVGLFESGKQFLSALKPTATPTVEPTLSAPPPSPTVIAMPTPTTVTATAQKKVSKRSGGVQAAVIAPQPRPATAATPAKEWKKWNAAPYAPSFVEGCTKAPATIDGFNLPLAVKAALKQKIGANCMGGVDVWLPPHMKLEQMMSGGAKPHVMNNVAVAELPVNTSPDGRPYRKGSVAETAKAAVWYVEYGGEKFAFYIPYVCYNLAWGLASGEQCVELPFNAPVRGFVRWGVASSLGPLPPSNCNAQRQGDGPWTAWVGECDDCVPPNDLFEMLGSKVRVPHKYLYGVTENRQTLRFSTAVWTRLVYICEEDERGAQSCGVYTRPQDWEGRYRVPIADTMWVWDTDSCTD